MKILRKWIWCVLAFGAIGTVLVIILIMLIAIDAIPTFIIGVMDHVGIGGGANGTLAYRGVEGAT
ncbi:MAG: hypothetical protein GF311_18195 [Candidatus Lokiarchaeota archaeon]|nr:hypothetical protein [Candidatus Lokiarchaeota archaeon]